MNSLVRILLAVALIAAIGGVWYGFYRSAPAAIEPQKAVETIRPDAVAPDPRLAFDTPFRNVKPHVKYVGDAACSGCHPTIDKNYHAHPMGRSAEYVAKASAIETYDAKNSLNVQGYGLRVERVGDAVRHRMTANDSTGKPLPDLVVTSDVAIGSGTRGRSYLTVADGAVTQTPISWFGQGVDKWDVSPGFDLSRGGQRPIGVECLFCHVDRVEPVGRSQNRYRQPLFAFQANVGCERCHGPGELHVAERSIGEPITGIDTTIVNPKHLSSELRMSICQQCHLQGEARVARRGRDLFDYRPGLPWEQFTSVFVRHPDAVDPHHSVGQFEQMTASQCFTASVGKMDCTTCHDPHLRPADSAMAAHFNARCQTCHEKKGCSLPAPARMAKDNSCITCHMPKASSTNIAHTSITDHRIPRLGSVAKPPTRRLPPGVEPLVAFRPTQYAPDADERSRDLGIALADKLGDLPPAAREMRRYLSSFAEDRLMMSLKLWPGDRRSWQASSGIHSARGDHSLAVKAAKTAVHLAPDSEKALTRLAQAANDDRQFDAAIAASEELIRINPKAVDHRLLLAVAYLGKNDYKKAETICRETLAIHSLHPQIHLYLGVCQHQQGDAKGGRQSRDTAIGLASQPAQKSAFGEWYAQQTR